MQLENRISRNQEASATLEDSIAPVEAPARSWLGLVPKPVKYLVGAAALMS